MRNAIPLLTTAFLFSTFTLSRPNQYAVAEVGKAVAPPDKPPGAVDTDTSNGPLIEIDAFWVRLDAKQIEDVQHPKPNTIASLSDPATLYCRAHTAGFSGQAVSIKAKQTATVVTGMTPIVAPNVVAYEAQSGTQESSVTLQLTPSLKRDNSNVLVELESAVIAEIKPDLQAVPQSSPPTTQRSETVPADEAFLKAARMVFPRTQFEQQFHTIVRLRTGVPMLVGGMTDRPGNAESKTLCLVLVARVEDPTDDK